MLSLRKALIVSTSLLGSALAGLPVSAQRPRLIELIDGQARPVQVLT